jgi:hypothetical protein
MEPAVHLLPFIPVGTALFVVVYVVMGPCDPRRTGQRRLLLPSSHP